MSESLRMLIDQGFETLALTQISFGIKLLAIFGAIYLFNILFKTGFSIISLVIYIIGAIKWIYYKMKGKEI